MWVSSLGQEDSLEEDMATHSSIFAWKIPGTEDPGGLQFMGSKRLGHDWSDLAHTHEWLLDIWKYIKLYSHWGHCKWKIPWSVIYQMSKIPGLIVHHVGWAARKQTSLTLCWHEYKLLQFLWRVTVAIPINITDVSIL